MRRLLSYLLPALSVLESKIAVVLLVKVDFVSPNVNLVHWNIQVYHREPKEGCAGDIPLGRIKIEYNALDFPNYFSVLVCDFGVSSSHCE